MSGDWLTATEVAELNIRGAPVTPRGVQLLAERERWMRPEWSGVRWRPRSGRGGGVEYHVSVLPERARLALAMRTTVDVAAEEASPEHKRADLWAWWAALPAKKRGEAERRLRVLDQIDVLVRSGMRKTYATMLVARKAAASPSRVYEWQNMVCGAGREDWLPLLAPRHAGRGAQAECSHEAWEALKADYLRLESPAFTDCHRRLVALAGERGWTLPSADTLRRRIEELPEAVRVLARQGVDAAKRLYPAQMRDRSMFHALQAVNADGHKWDVFVRWPDGTVGRPVMVVFQDLYSGKILSWRVDRTENREAVRLAFGDVVSVWGIPDDCWLDNGRNFASKWLTGGMPNRHRFKVRDEDPVGVLTQLGVTVHWTTPYSGQSKPIERAFRDFAQGLARHPAFAGAWCGNNPMAKPENYGSKAVPIETFLDVIAGGIIEHNARPGRRTQVCGGTQSFDRVFNVSYSQSPIRKATKEQQRLWLLAAEAIRVSPRDGSVELLGNRYWSEILLGLRGQRVVVRFDPQCLQEDLLIYRMDGAFVGAAPCTVAAGFDDVEAARTHNRARRTWLRAQREMLRAERSMSLDELVAMQKAAEPAPPPETKIVRLVGARVGRAPGETADDRYEREAEEQGRLLAAMGAAARASRGAALRLVEDE